jgi:hypothetical protein
MNSTTWYSLTPTQVSRLVDILDHELVQNLCVINNWYAQFVPGVRYDIIRQQAISARQLDQLRKLCAVTGQTWQVVL